MQILTIIEPGQQERNYWGDIWRHRELIQVLAWRDLFVRYKQTVIGAIWALIRPLLTMLVLPQLIIPTAAVVVAFVYFLISFTILVALFVWYQFLPSWHMIYLPVFIVFAFHASIFEGNTA